MARNRSGSAAPSQQVLASKVRPAKKSPEASPDAEDSGDAAKGFVARGRENLEGGTVLRTDPLQDSAAARELVEALDGHKAELRRRGLFARDLAGALTLADSLELLLQAQAGAALEARGRSPELAELLADAAASALAVREAVARVTRGAKGRAVAYAFGLGEAFNARRPVHVARALRRILEGAEAHPAVSATMGMLEEDRTTFREMAQELERAPGADKSDTSNELHVTHHGLRAFFDLVAAKLSLALAGDPEERKRLLAIIPRANERRHVRRAE